MRRFTLVLLTSAAVVLLADGTVRAQPPSQVPYTRPTYSPYLNLFRRGTPLYQNYYGLVRPEIETRANIQRLQQQVTANRQAITSAEQEVETGLLPPTGHRFGYMTHTRFFMNHGASGVGGFGGVGGFRSGGAATGRPFTGASAALPTRGPSIPQAPRR
ncbi:MAG TPA: hypothetical protein VNK04_17885 [Gemmataceae bacterium]|jgi:hypothetical protein|nr:hypothetical protein [Gemmataceae bacterium]